MTGAQAVACSTEQKLPLPQITFTSHLLGPLQGVLPWCGFDLTRSDLSKCKNRPLSVLATSVCVVLIFLFLVEIVLIAISDKNPFSLDWADANLRLGMIGYALASAICIAVWSRTGFLDSFQEQLRTLKNLRVLSNNPMDDYFRVYVQSVVCSSIIIISWGFMATKDILFAATKNNGSELFVSRYVVAWRTLYGLEPFVLIWMGIATSLATVIYSLALCHLNREMTYFNEELQKASRAQQLTVPDIFIAYGRRHFDLMLLLKHTNAHLGKLTCFAALAAIWALINAIYIIAGFNKDISLCFMIGVFLWTGICFGLLLVVLGQAGKVQESVHRTMCILLDDDTIPAANDQRIVHSYRMFIDRCRFASTMYLVNAFPVDTCLIHKVLFVAPNIGTLLAYIKRIV